MIFWRWVEPDDDSSDKRRYAVIRYYRVFNVEQCEGLAAVSTNVGAEPEQPFSNIEACEQVLARRPPELELREEGACAFYDSEADAVTVPPRGSFDPPEEFYATCFHELVHATAHPQRLARPGIADRTRFGDHRYSTEELVAEMGAAFLCGQAGIDAVTLENSAAYIDGWIRQLRGDSRLVVQAAARHRRPSIS